MATGSTASSGTEGLDPQEPEEASAPEAAAPSDIPTDSAPPVESGHDASRRAFFFEFGKQAVSAAGQVAGMADLVGRTPGGSITSLLGLDEPETPAAPRATFARSEGGPVSVAPPAADDVFRSPYRLAGDELVLLDQRGIPERLDEVVAKRGSDVAYYLRIGVARGGPVMAQVAAYGLALTAAERAGRPPEQLDVELRRTERALAGTRPSSRLLAWSMARMRSVIEALGDSDAEEASAGVDIGAALRAEADAIAGELGAAQATIANTLVQMLTPARESSAANEPATSAERPLAVLMHGDLGALSGGLVGTALPALRQLHEAGREMRIFVTEGRPFMDGARLASWELRQAGIEHKIIPDAAVAWLFDREPIDAVLMGGEWIAANGDVGALIGSRAIAQLAAESGPRVIVTAVAATIDQATPDGAAIPAELRPAGDLVAYLADTPIRASDALVPATDVVPAATVSALVTERGVVEIGEAR